MANIKDAVFYKNIKPEYDSSYVLTSGWNEDLDQLDELLKSWGFSDVNFDDVSGWRIEEDSTYGPRILFRDTGYAAIVKCSDIGFRYLKCKSKQTSYHLLEADNNGWVTLYGDYIAPGAYSIYISDLGFARNVENVFLVNNKSFFTASNFMKGETRKPYTHAKTYFTETKISEDSNWPWGNIYVPGYGINNVAVNGSAFLYTPIAPQSDFEFNTPITFSKPNGNNSFFSDTALKMNFTNYPLDKYMWLYEDFTYSFTLEGSDTRRRGYNYIHLQYYNKKLTLKGSKTITGTPSIIKIIDFDPQKNVCWLYYRIPTENKIQSPKVNFYHTYENPMSTLKTRGITASVTIDPDSFVFKLNDIKYKLINFSEAGTDTYIFDYFDSIYKNYNISKESYEDCLDDVEDSLGVNSPHWTTLAKSFIESSGDVTFTHSESPEDFSDKAFLGNNYTKFNFPEKLPLSIKLTNNQKLKDTTPNYTDMFKASWWFEAKGDFITLVLTDSASLTTYMKYIYEWNRCFNGMLQNGPTAHWPADCNLTNKADANYEYWYKTSFFDQNVFTTGTDTSMSTYATVESTHSLSVGVGSGPASSAAIGILILYKE